MSGLRGWVGGCESGWVGMGGYGGECGWVRVSEGGCVRIERVCVRVMTGVLCPMLYFIECQCQCHKMY